MVPLKQACIRGQTPIAHFIYGTAWKGDKTAHHVLEALRAGFRAIDTAPQSTNYNEALVGQALRAWDKESSSTTLELQPKVFVQSKFTIPSGYGDGPKPFEDGDSPMVQIQKSVQTSFQHLNRGNNGQPPLDALLLHSPLATVEETMTYWNAMEAYVPEKILYLGICNVSCATFMDIYSRATVKPAIVQNDFRPAHGFDAELLRFCQQQGTLYEAYAVLKGNLSLLGSPLVRWLASEKGVTEPEALYCLVLSCWEGRLCVLNGTRSEDTMKKDLELLEKVGKLEQFIIDGFWEAMAQAEQKDWPSDKSV